jgi:hypothetical protein
VRDNERPAPVGKAKTSALMGTLSRERGLRRTSQEVELQLPKARRDDGGAGGESGDH